MAANVAGRCKVTAAPGILNFGTIDPTGVSNAIASTTFSIKCTKGTVSTSASDDGGLYFSTTRRMRHSVNAANFLPYAIGFVGDAGFIGQGFGAAALARSVTITGGITPTQFQNALVTAAGQVYADTVTITVNP
jgi:spore coat protein U-like protein